MNEHNIQQTPAMQTARIDARTAVAITLTVVTWASAFAGIRAGLTSYSPQSVALLRYLVAALALGGYALATRMPLPRKRDWPGIVALGFVGFAFYNVALNAGEVAIPAGTASLLIASAPIFVALLAMGFFGERLTLLGWGGIALSFVGVAVISIEPESGLQLSASALLVLAAAVAQAVYSVGQKPLLTRYSPLQVTSYAIWAGTAFLLFFLPGLLRDFQTASTPATLAVVYMGIFPGALGYVSWSYVLSRLLTARAGSFLYLIPVVAIAIAWLWLGERPDTTAVLGGTLILLGVILVNLRRRRSA